MKSLKRLASVLGLAGIMVLSACRADKPSHVVIIGIDGWAASEFNAEEMPFCASLKEKGAWTLDKRCVIPTASAINWMTLFSGVQPEYHGYSKWNSCRPDFDPAWTDSRGEVPTIFHLLRSQKPESNIMCTYGWDVIASLVDSTAMDSLVHFEMSAEGDSLEVEYVNAYFKEHKPTLSLVYFANLDHNGHQFGWKSPEYHSYMTWMDEMVRRVVEGIREAGMEDDTVVVLTTDHGGYGKAHGGQYYNEVLKTPLFIWGKGIKKGCEITAPTIQMDITATVAEILDVKTPAHWTGRVLEEIFE